MKVFHGTTSEVADRLAKGRAADMRRVFKESNVSLGGTYVTNNREMANVYAQTAARVNGGEPMVLEINVPQSDLLPDEDFVVHIAHSSEDEPITKRLQSFMDDLFQGYPGEGFSLSDHYKTKYGALNARHGITWKDSWKWMGSARMDRPIRPDDVVRAYAVA